MRRWISVPLRVFNNQSTGRKLALTSVGALALLSGVSWFALDRLTVVGSLQDGVAAESAAERQIQDTLLSALELRVISRELQYQQSVLAVRRAVERADAQRAAAQQALHEAQARASDPDDQARLQKAIAALDELAAAVQREGRLRSDLLTARQRNLFQMRPVFEQALDSFTQELQRGSAVQSGVDAVRDDAAKAVANVSDPAQIALNQYRLAMARLQSDALMFLATGNPAAANEVRDAAQEAERQMAVILNGKLADDVKADARTVALVGKGIAGAADGLIDQTKQLDAMTRKEVEGASKAMQQAIADVAQSFATRVRRVSEAAQAGRRTAQQQEIELIGGIAVLVLVLGTLMTRVIAGPLRALTRSVQAIAQGETATQVGYTGRHDEIGQMATAVETLRGVMQKTFVQSQMIEQIPVGVMTAATDEQCRITYLNAEALRIMDLLEEALPVAPRALLGQSAAIFHENAEERLSMLRDPANLPQRARIVLGAETLEIRANAIRDKDGAYVGPMLIWQRLTDQVRMAQHFEGSVKTIAETVGASADSMKQTASLLSDAAADSSHRTNSAGTAATAAAQHIGSAAAGAEELAASVAEIGRQVAESARIAGVGVREAEAADRCVGSLSEAAGRIGDVVRLISDIASRTNLLALNATIEAARAGEAGKGFAVVASEVKTLATQTAHATEEIGAQISSIQGATGEAVSTLRSIAATIERMNEIATAIAGAVEEQGAATREIAAAVQQAASGAEAVTSDIIVVSRSVDNTGVQAGDVLSAARKLAEQSASLKHEVQSFLTSMQTAA